MIFEERKGTFRDIYEKADYLERGAQADAYNGAVVRWARQFDEIEDERLRAESILRFCQICVKYVNDPGYEVLDSSEVALVRGFGDCDVKARLFVGLCVASGLEAKTEPIFQGTRFPHIRAKVRLRGAWQSCDPCVVNSSVGQIPTQGAKTEWRQ